LQRQKQPPAQVRAPLGRRVSALQLQAAARCFLARRRATALRAARAQVGANRQPPKHALARSQAQGMFVSGMPPTCALRVVLLFRRHAVACAWQMVASRYWEDAHVVYELPPVEESNVFVVGAEVEARYKGRHAWFHAMVVATHQGGAFFDLWCVSWLPQRYGAQGKTCLRLLSLSLSLSLSLLSPPSYF
jgi:hypothetical protein